MSPAALAWVCGRLAARARDARQAEISVHGLHRVDRYEAALVLGEAHARAAEVYERALAELNAKAPATCGPKNVDADGRPVE
jgi:hypothetical protein